MAIKIENSDKTIIFHFSEELTFKNHPEFNQHMEEIEGDNRDVILDVSNLNSIDSAGIGMLFLAQKITEKNGANICIKNPQGQVKRIFEITSIGQQIKVQES